VLGARTSPLHLSAQRDKFPFQRLSQACCARSLRTDCPRSRHKALVESLLAIEKGRNIRLHQLFVSFRGSPFLHQRINPRNHTKRDSSSEQTENEKSKPFYTCSSNACSDGLRRLSKAGK